MKRNKLFFFASYQGTRQVNGLDNTSVSNLILPALTDDRSAATLAAQFCPGNHARRRAVPDLRRRAATRLRQSEHRHHGADQPRRAAAAPDEGQRRPIPDSFAADDRVERSEAGLGFSSYSMPSTYNEHHYVGNGDYVMSARNTLSARLFAATVDQLRTFGSPGGYPGAPIVPGFGAAQALAATDVATSLRFTTQVDRQHR